MTAPSGLVRKVYALLNAAEVRDRNDKLRLFRWILHDPSVSSTNDLDRIELEAVANTLEHWQRQGELVDRTRAVIDDVKAGNL